MHDHSLGQEFGFQKHNEIDVNYIWGVDQDFFPGCLGGGGAKPTFPTALPFLHTYMSLQSPRKNHPTCIDQFLADIFQNYLCLYEVCKSCRLPGRYPDLPDGGHHTGNHIRVQSLKVFMVAWCLNPINYNTKYFALIFFVLCCVVL